MKKDVNDYIGKRFGMLTVIGPDTRSDHFNSNHWVFKCDCGKKFSDYPSRVLSGHKKSCGCNKGKGTLTHGCNGDEFYPTWWGMMRRCYHKENHNYSRYGGRGITVCDEWHDPEKFILWAHTTAGHKTSGISLDRIDNSKGYSPENCRWATSSNQANNRRNNRVETIGGESKNITEWCRIYGISTQLVNARQRKGMSFEEALKTPVSSHKKDKTAP